MQKIKNTEIFKKVKKEEDVRTNFMFGFIGHNRTGKTSIAKEIAKQWKLTRPDGYIIAFDPQSKFNDLADEFILQNEVRTWVDKVISHRKVLLILDDYRTLHTKSIADESLLTLMSLRCEYNIDIIYITHNPALVLNIFTYYTTHYFIFFTQSLMGSFEKKIPNYTCCQAAVTQINNYVKTYGKGDYPNFPYIVVDVQNEILTAQNIDYNKIKKINKI